LSGDELLDSVTREREQRVELRALQRVALGRALDLDVSKCVFD
jgi:hypothetical protein